MQNSFLQDIEHKEEIASAAFDSYLTDSKNLFKLTLKQVNRSLIQSRTKGLCLHRVWISEKSFQKGFNTQSQKLCFTNTK